jgi:four helix bundle protein
MWRFQQLEVWQRAAAISPSLFDVASLLSEKQLYRWGEQLRAAALSITNNIAEGSGSTSKADFGNFLNIARRSVFETANILILLRQQSLLSADTSHLLDELEEISRMLFALRKSLL